MHFRILSLYILLLSSIAGFSQAGAGFNPHYHFLRSGNLVADKNFYLLTVLDKDSTLAALLRDDSSLSFILKSRKADLSFIMEAGHPPLTLLTRFLLTREDSTALDSTLGGLYDAHPQPFERMINTQLRPSGYYQRWAASSNKELFLRAWGDYTTGFNLIIRQYGLGQKIHYPAIDSATYNVHGDYYTEALTALFDYLSERTGGMNLFYQPYEALALQLLDLNDRDEAARFEPLATGSNLKARQAIKSIPWKQYPYSVILVPGEGPELPGIPIDPIGKMRCQLAAARYHKGMAPFILVSGGFVHPFHTPYAEAAEMKKYLVQYCSIPEAAIIIEPQARHTTTNLRNSNRLIYRYGLPVGKPILVVTTKDQADYIMNPGFDRRNDKELHYQPYKQKMRLSPREISYYPVIESLQMDAADSLDP